MKTRQEIFQGVYHHGLVARDILIGDHVVFSHSPYIFENDDLNIGMVIAVHDATSALDAVVIRAADGTCHLFSHGEGGGEWELGTPSEYKWSWGVWRNKNTVKIS